MIVSCGKCGHDFTSLEDFTTDHGCNRPAPDVPAFTCPRCHRTEYDTEHVAQGYCSRCGDWTRPEGK